MQDTICSGGLCVTADDRGAEPVSISFQGKERLWQNENGAWAGHAPLLFPVCGNCEVIVNGRRYPVPKHGFAKKSRFTLAEKREDFLRYELCGNAETAEVYPFPFRLAVAYRIQEGALEITYEVANTGEAPLIFSIGAHPCFALEGEPSEYELVFEREEHFLHLVHDKEGLLTGEEVDFGTGTVFPVPAERLTDGNTLIFGNVRSASVLLRRRTGEKTAEYSFEGFSHLLLWRPEGARALCIEPWCNLPGKAGEECGFAGKKGVVTLGAGESKRFFQKIVFHEK